MAARSAEKINPSAADGNSARHQRSGDRDDNSFLARGGREPCLELGAYGEHHRQDPVKLDRVDPEAAETQKAGAHAPKVDGRARRVISRLADLAALEDQPRG